MTEDKFIEKYGFAKLGGIFKFHDKNVDKYNKQMIDDLREVLDHKPAEDMAKDHYVFHGGIDGPGRYYTEFKVPGLIAVILDQRGVSIDYDKSIVTRKTYQRVANGPEFREVK